MTERRDVEVIKGCVKLRVCLLTLQINDVYRKKMGRCCLWLEKS